MGIIPVISIKKTGGKTKHKTTASHAISEPVLDVLKQQLDVKDKQIAKLQDSLQFAQAVAAENQKKLDNQSKLLEHRETDKKDMQNQIEDLQKQLEEAQKAVDDTAILKQELTETKQHAESLENRGFCARLLNRK